MSLGVTSLDDSDHALAAALLTVPGVRAVLLGGSRADGSADAASDTDLYALHRGPLAADTARARALRGIADGGRITHQDTWGPEDHLHVGGRLVEVVHLDLDALGLDAAYDPGLDPSGYTTAFLHTLAHGVTVADPHGEIAAVQQRLATYPEATGRRVLDQAPTELMGYLDQLAKARARQDWTSVLHRRAALQTTWFDALFALNGAFHPGEKRLLEHAGRLVRTVDDLHDRWTVVSLARGDDAELLPRLSSLVEDLLALYAGSETTAGPLRSAREQFPYLGELS